MKILFLAERFPYPLHDGGSLRTFHVLRVLSQRHDVTMICHQPWYERQESLNALESFCRVSPVGKSSVMVRLTSNILRAPIGQAAYLMKNRSRPILKQAEQTLATDRFEAIHFNMLDTATFASERTWNQKLVFDSHNCLSQMAFELSERTDSAVKRSLLRRESATLRSAESAALGRLDATIACSDIDADHFRSMSPRGRIVVAPNGVDCDSYHPGKGDLQESGLIVFTGVMNYFPNVEGVSHFVDEILPIIRKRVPHAKLEIVGADPVARIRQFDERDGISVTGRVADVKSYLHRAECVIVPLLTGSGTRLKILEAFAAGKAIVSTTKGAEGIDAEHGKHFLLSDSTDEFSEAVIRVLTDSDYRKSVGSAARDLAQSRYDWEIAMKPLTDLYDSLAESERHSRAGVQVT